MSALAFDRHRDLRLCAVANQNTAREVRCGGFRAFVDSWMYGNCFGHFCFPPVPSNIHYHFRSPLTMKVLSEGEAGQ
jgi:hypothetical protein